MTRRLLLISYVFKPEPSPGSLRAGALAKWLPGLGWEVDLVTRTPPSPAPNGRVIVVPHKPWIERLRFEAGIRPDLWFRAPPLETHKAGVVEPPKHLSGRAYGVFRRTILQAATWPDRIWDWAPRVWPQVRDLVRSRPPDVVLSTSPPEISHFLARRVKRASQCAWIADLRDPWSDTELMAHARWRRALDRLTERRILGDADTLVTVSEPIAERLRGIHPTKKAIAILNGFDPELFPGPAVVDRARFTVMYTGGVILGKHDVVTFLAGARRFVDGSGRGVPFSIRFLGEASQELRTRVEEHGLGAITSLEGRRPHEVAVESMRSTAVNLFLPWQDPSETGVYSGKLFEYLGARRPILAVGPVTGVATELVESTGAGRIAKNAEEVAARLGELWEAHRQGRDAWAAEESVVVRHSHREMVAAFARELDVLGSRAE